MRTGIGATDIEWIFTYCAQILTMKLQNTAMSNTDLRCHVVRLCFICHLQNYCEAVILRMMIHVVMHARMMDKLI